jgi:hypothetical protein
MLNGFVYLQALDGNAIQGGYMDTSNVCLLTTLDGKAIQGECIRLCDRSNVCLLYGKAVGSMMVAFL